MELWYNKPCYKAQTVTVQDLPGRRIHQQRLIHHVPGAQAADRDRRMKSRLADKPRLGLRLVTMARDGK